VDKGALDGDRIVALNKNCQALEQEGRLADIICDLLLLLLLLLFFIYFFFYCPPAQSRGREN